MTDTQRTAANMTDAMAVDILLKATMTGVETRLRGLLWDIANRIKDVEISNLEFEAAIQEACSEGAVDEPGCYTDAEFNDIAIAWDYLLS